MSNLTNEEKDVRPEVFLSDMGVRRSATSKQTDKPHTLYKSALRKSHNEGG